MKAAVTTAYGPPNVVQLRDLPKPAPQKGDLLVRVQASPVTAGDARIRGLDVPSGFGPFVRLAFGLTRPRRPVQGWALAGVVDAVGQGVTGFKTGDRVFGLTGMRGGAHAEYAVLSAAKAWHLPETLSMEQGACFFFGGLTAKHFLIDKAGLVAGERILVNGATGAVGTACLQIARQIGAHVTAVCSARNADLALQMGAERVIDYQTQQIDGTYDVIVDIPGTLPYPRARAHLSPNGRLLLITASLGQTLGSALHPRRGTHRVISGSGGETGETVAHLLRLHDAGAYTPVVGATMPLDQIAKAHAKAGSLHNSGNLVVVMK